MNNMLKRHYLYLQILLFSGFHIEKQALCKKLKKSKIGKAPPVKLFSILLTKIKMFWKNCVCRYFFVVIYTEKKKIGEEFLLLKTLMLCKV